MRQLTCRGPLETGVRLTFGGASAAPARERLAGARPAFAAVDRPAGRIGRAWGRIGVEPETGWLARSNGIVQG